ncbi:hypothetical protein MTR67_009491, partial [Solanum verrucosum]
MTLEVQSTFCTMFLMTSDLIATTSVCLNSSPSLVLKVMSFSED